MPTLNVNPNTIVVQTAAQWALDTDVYSARTILVTSDVYFTGTNCRKIKIADETNVWADIDYLPDANALIATMTLADVISNNPSTGDQTINSPNSQSQLNLTDASARVSSENGTVQNELLLTLLQSSLLFNNGTETGEVGMDATDALISHTQQVNIDAPIINIGNVSSAVNILGTLLYENVTNLEVTDKLITLNKGGAAGTATGTGIEFEENSVITGYIKTNASRNAFEMLTPAIAFKLIQSLASLGADRTITWPDASGTPLLNDNTAAVTNKTIDGDNNTIQNLVYTALKTVVANANKFIKYNASGVPEIVGYGTGANTVTEGNDSRLSDTRIIKVLGKSQTQSNHTGNINNTKLTSFLIPANTIQVGDWLMITTFVSKSGSGGTASIRIYFNDTDNLTTPVQVGLANLSTANTFGKVSRELFVRSATETIGYVNNQSLFSDATNSNNGFSINNIDWTVNQYFVVAGQLADAGDVVGVEGLMLNIRR